MSFKITRGIKLVVGRVTEGVKGGLMEFWGGPGGSKGVCPSGSLVGHWIWFQTPLNGPTGQCLQGRHH